MRVIVVAHDVPWPPDHGGRLDMWNRSAALRSFGATLDLVAWTDQEPGAASGAALDEVYDRSLVFARDRRLLRALHPLLATQMHALAGPDRRRLEAAIAVAAPGVVLLEGLGGWDAARWLQRRYGLPVVYRSHNVEYLYMGSLKRASTSPVERLKLLLNVPRTLRAERHARRDSAAVFDIAKEDLAHWRGRQPTWRAELQPFNLHPSVVPPPTRARPVQGVTFLGNLRSPNNLHAIAWFVDQVVPHLGGLPVTIAGSRPTAAAHALAARAGIRILADPPDALALHAASAVVVNPIWHGSGMNVKMVEMLLSGRPVVSTTIGSRGLPAELRAHVIVRDEATAFAEAVVASWERGPDRAQQEAVLRHFSWRNVQPLFECLRSVAGASRP